MIIKTADIHVGDRQRKGEKQSGSLSADKVNELAVSFQRYGQMQPIVVVTSEEEGKCELVAGFNRLTAARLLGWDEIEAVFMGDIDDITAKEMELEENIRRTELEWWERAAATAEIHDMKVAADPNWTMQKTADMVGISKTQVSMSKDLISAIGEDPALKGEETLRGALKKRKVDKQIEKRKKTIALKEAGVLTSHRAEIRTGDARDLICEETDESFDAVITNFPFGVDLVLKGGETPYHDEEEYIIGLVQDVVAESYRILTYDSWMVAWFDLRKITYSNPQLELYKKLSNTGWTRDGSQEMRNMLINSMGLTFWMEQAGFNYVTLLPAIWAKPNKSQGLIGDPNKGMITGYEAMVFAAKGNAVFHRRGRSNLFIFDTPATGDKVHPLQMPTDLCSEIISMVCLGGSRILDPFAGSGSIGMAALERQCEFVGYELDPVKAENGNLRLREWESDSV